MGKGGFNSGFKNWSKMTKIDFWIKKIINCQVSKITLSIQMIQNKIQLIIYQKFEKVQFYFKICNI